MTIQEIKKLLALIEQSSLEEVRIQTDKIKISGKKSTPVVMPTVLAAGSDTGQTNPAVLEVAGSGAEQTGSVVIQAPMVGTFYHASSPEAAPFVQVGDHVQKGQKVGVIEAMKLFNEIESEVSGTITQVLTGNASPVEYGQGLFAVVPDE